MNECDLLLMDIEKLMFILFIKYCSVDQIYKNEMGGECGTYGGEERYIQRLGVGKLRVRDHLEDPGVDGKIILRWIFRKWEGAWTGSSWVRIGSGGGDL
jgi:hypothetical protein